MAMQQSLEASACSCMGGLFATPDALFLTRKGSPQDSPAHSRNKSSELLMAEGEGKPMKRSLRKRPSSSSNIPAEMVQPLSFLEQPPLPELRIDFKPDPQTLNHDYSFSIIEDLPHSTARQSHQRQLSPNAEDRSPSPGNKPHQMLLEQMLPMTPPQGGIYRGSPQRFQPQSLPFLSHPPAEVAHHHYQ
jgi:hypothetical protein